MHGLSAPQLSPPAWQQNTICLHPVRYCPSAGLGSAAAARLVSRTAALCRSVAAEPGRQLAPVLAQALAAAAQAQLGELAGVRGVLVGLVAV